MADRYELVEVIGTGGTSTVHAALDRVTGARVAVKLLVTGPINIPGRVRREVAALRLLQLPGVVTLLDEGVHDGTHFLVMDVVDGTPFPGDAAPADWEGLAPIVVAFVETLARIHAAGVIHRDLKPGNVLVGADRRVTVLDFGLSRGPALGGGLTTVGTIVGTPEYLAPEQLLGGEADVRSDLYAVGVMLYELFAGRLPHVASDFQELAERKRSMMPVPLLRVAPSTPRNVALVVDRLLSIDPADRPRSAGETLDGLFGHMSVACVERELPRLGGGSTVAAILAAVDRRQSMDVVGPHGSGRTRLLVDLSGILQARGAAVRWVPPGRSPYTSLAALLGGFDGLDDAGVDDAPTMIRGRVVQFLRSGDVLLVDDAERVDRWSAEILDSARSEGSIVRAISREVEDAVRLRALTEEELRPLFAGPDRIFHLREDGARELWRRTGGLPARVATEIAAWVRAGLAHYLDDQLVVRRGILDRLRGGLPVGDPQSLHPGIAAPIAPELDELLAWVALAWPSSSPAVLARAMARPRWRLDPELSALEEAGVVLRTDDGRVQPLMVPRSLQAWSLEQRRNAHRGLSSALPSGTPDRIRHLAAAGEPHEIVEEALLVAPVLTREGRTSDAIVLLEQALAAARVMEDRRGEEAVLIDLAKACLPSADPADTNRALYALERMQDAGPLLRSVAELLRAGAAAGRGDAEAALRDLDAIPPFEDQELEGWRQAKRVTAAQRLSIEREAAVLAEIDSWARAVNSDRMCASVDGWKALHCYRLKKFDEAADLHLSVCDRGERALGRWSSYYNAALALLEAGRLGEAQAAVEGATRIAAACRSPNVEAHAEMLLRAIRYRRAGPMELDPELVEAVEALGNPVVDSQFFHGEAAIAWRLGDLASARAFASRARAAAEQVCAAEAEILARALELLAGLQPGDEAIDRLVRDAELYPDWQIAVQALGMVAEAVPERAPSLRALARQRLQGVKIDPKLRGEVLTIREILEGVSNLSD